MRLEGLYRVDVPEIAIPALREAIINAFCHRDYRDPDYVQVAIFKDRVEIRNPGILFGGLTLEKLRTGKHARRRNPLIVQMLTRIQMVEAWGRGMTLILDNEPTTLFEEIAGMFIATFARSSFAETEQASLSVVPTTDKTTDKTIENAFSANEKAILALIAVNPSVTQKEMAAALGLSEDGIRYHMEKLKTKGLLRREGGKKAGRWKIVPE